MDRSSFSGRVALITGASGGIGQALARRLAAGGAVLGLGYGTHGRAAEALAPRARTPAPARGPRPRPLPGRAGGTKVPAIGQPVPLDLAGRARWAMRWKPMINAFAITFGGRFPAARTC